MTHVSVFVLSIILSRYFTKDDYGTYLHVQLIINVATWSFLLGIPHGIYYFLPKILSQRRYVLSVIASIICIAVIVSSTILLNIDSLEGLLNNPRLSEMGFIISFIVLVSITLTIFEPLMITAGKVKEFSIVELTFNLMFFFSVAIPVFLDKEMTEIIWWLAGQYFIQSMVVMYFSLTIALKYKRDNTTGEEIPFREQISYSLPIGISQIVLEMSRYVDKMVVSNQSNAADYALYVRGAMEIPVIGIIANTLDNLLMPQFVEAYKKNNIQEIVTSWHRTIRLMAMFIYPSCLFLIITAGLLIPAIFSDKYIGSVIIFQIYTISLLSRISTFDVIMRVIGQTKYILWISLISILFNVVLTFLFMEAWGLVGAPIATVITLILMRIAYLVAITKFFELRISNVFPWKSILSSLLLSMVASLPVLMMVNIAMNVWLKLILCAIVFSSIYLVLLRFTAILTEDDRQLLKSYFPKKIHWAI